MNISSVKRNEYILKDKKHQLKHNIYDTCTKVEKDNTMRVAVKKCEGRDL